MRTERTERGGGRRGIERGEKERENFLQKFLPKGERTSCSSGSGSGTTHKPASLSLLPPPPPSHQCKHEDGASKPLSLPQFRLRVVVGVQLAQHLRTHPSNTCDAMKNGRLRRIFPLSFLSLSVASPGRARRRGKTRRRKKRGE